MGISYIIEIMVGYMLHERSLLYFLLARLSHVHTDIQLVSQT